MTRKLWSIQGCAHHQNVDDGDGDGDRDGDGDGDGDGGDGGDGDGGERELLKMSQLGNGS